MPSHLLTDSYVAVCPEGATRLADSSCDNASGSSRFWYIRALSVKKQDLLLSIEVTACKHVAGSGKVYNGLRNRNGNYCRHSERLWKLMIEHTDHVARCASGGRAARCSRV